VKLNAVVYGIVVIVLFLGTIFGFKSAGVWSVSGKVTATGERVQPSGADVDEIKGWMEIGQVAAAYSIPVEDILNAFGLSLDTPPSRQIKELESESFSPAALREWLSARMTASP
jgi:hypothetical protein